MMKINRYPFKEKYLFFIYKGKIKRVNVLTFINKHKISGIIKFTEEEFKNIKKKTKCLRHFNIQYCGHKKGHFYMLVKIIKKGSFDGKIFKSPVLDQNKKILAQCTYVKNFVNYNSLNKDDFKNCIKLIKNKTTLKRYIIRRYNKSLSHLSTKKKISMGISITDLKLNKFIIYE